ncbi:MAG: sigma 54-interacting transcriptional regulator, partial [Deltaproteobacteria bacterium]
DSNDRIRRANLKALEYLNVESDDLLNMKFRDLALLSDWKDREKPFSITLPNGTKIHLERRPLVHQRRLIGSLILLESVNKVSKKHLPPLMDLHWTRIGQSPAFKKVLESAENAARYDSNVLITGETGTGKEVIARYIHEKSQRRDKPFVAINCGSIPRELLGSELFGYEAGAFTGAKQKGHPGKFELANGGTLLLDEISEMPLESQVYLLRVIEEKAVTRLGGSKVIPVDTRIIAAPGKNLHEEVEAGRFRADLLFRINVLHIDLPPLKGRKEDIPLLVDHFVHTLSESMDKKVTQITGDALAALTAYDWPGNVRELRNVIEQAIVMCPKDTIMWECLPDHIRNAGPISDDIREKDRERYLRFIKAYNDSDGNISQVARIMDVSRPTVYAWKKKFGLD